MRRKSGGKNTHILTHTHEILAYTLFITVVQAVCLCDDSGAKPPVVVYFYLFIFRDAVITLSLTHTLCLSHTHYHMQTTAHHSVDTRGPKGVVEAVLQTFRPLKN